MSIIQTLTLFGTHDARLQAKCVLENHPQVRRIDIMEEKMMLRIISRKRLNDTDLVDLLHDTGIIGFRFETDR